MRPWHQSLLPYLTRQQLLGQHRERCALRGKGWGKKHSVVNYAFEHPYADLYVYHCLVIGEMEKRGYDVDDKWSDPAYRGKALGRDFSLFSFGKVANILEKRAYHMIVEGDDLVYPEHDDAYLKECLENLKGKGIVISIDH